MRFVLEARVFLLFVFYCLRLNFKCFVEKARVEICEYLLWLFCGYMGWDGRREVGSGKLYFRIV